MSREVWPSLNGGTEPAWYRFHAVGTGNLSPLVMVSGRSQMVGTGSALRVVGPVETQLTGAEIQAEHFGPAAAGGCRQAHFLMLVLSWETLI